MRTSLRQRSIAVVALVFLTSIPLWSASACGGPADPKTPSPAASASASVALFTQSSGASPIELTWKSGACDVEIRDGLGATYRFSEGTNQTAHDVIRGTVDKCLRAPSGTQGTLYIEATVAGAGALSNVVVSPGGAISTQVVQCLTKSFVNAKVPAPEDPGSVLLLFVVSACPAP